jgi:ATPases involved in chromosome partitioning
MERTIIPIASGKGGVGKSFLAANLGIELAHSGKNVIVADLDFGGSNLHTCLGIHNVNPGIGDFLRARIGSLEDQLVSTDTENLRFLAGDVRSPFLANMHHAQKMRLIHNLKKLDCEFLILDLGSGSTYNTLDFFGMTQLGLIVTTTEHTSTMNMLTFLKLFAFRIIQRSLPGNIFIQDKLTELYNLSIKGNILTRKGFVG